MSRRVFPGLALAAFFGPMCTADASPYRPSQKNLPLLGTLSDAIAHSTKINQTFVRPPAFLGRVPQSTGLPLLMYDTTLELDSDGWLGDSRNPNWQPTTSLRLMNGASLDANRVPYIVLPLPKSWPAQFGITLGDYAAVLYCGVLTFAVFGDQGPARKLGEGSIELLRNLGQERVRSNGTLIVAGTDPGVLCIVFPGSGTTEDRWDETTLLRAIDTKGPKLFSAAGGKVPS